ncbi:chromate transport protein [Chloropicon primus]|uniref:Chromate transport protein n=1 Tax=Chloropicon primus TaxID=1764295 RepID=A0A5B8MTH8_9CHLO|nr:chromate transport protein [Chloropicon primus]UPR03296.1 chromate transport protein [Chloropicon primus]|eukprot:QDZ24088.1 chromate transport protein [Chloropicon primus]
MEGSELLQKREDRGLLEGGDGNGGIYAQVSYLTIMRDFFALGWLSFGGPVAHIATFEQVFVQRKAWMSSYVFTEFLALGQCITGPTACQLSFAIGVVKKGVRGGLLSGSMFLLPGFLLLSIIGATSGEAFLKPSPLMQALVAGLTSVAIALVAGAAKALGSKICDDKITICICAVSAATALYWKGSFVMPLVMGVGGVVTIAAYRNKPPEVPGKSEEGGINSLGLGTKGGGILLGVWVAVLVALLVLKFMEKGNQTYPPLSWFSTFYMAGSLIFGGAPVLIPLLLDKMTAPGTCADSQDDCRPWMTEDQFYAGLAAAQSMPGPMFNFSAYLGAVIAMNAGFGSFFGTLVCWVGLLAPGIMLIFSVLPFWGKFRTVPLYKRALPGINSAAVGLIVTAVFKMTFQAHENSPFPQASSAIGVLAFTAVSYLKLPAPLAVIAGGCLGMIAHAVQRHEGA